MHQIKKNNIFVLIVTILVIFQALKVHATLVPAQLLIEKTVSPQSNIQIKNAPLKGGYPKLDTELQLMYLENISQAKSNKTKIFSTQSNPSQNKISVVIQSNGSLDDNQINQIKNINGSFVKSGNKIVNFGNIYLVQIPLEQLQKLSNLSFIIKVENGQRQYRPSLDVSVPRIGAPSVWAKNDNSNSRLTGTGVLVAVIDTGVDFTNPMFYYTNGTSKIRLIRDHTTGEVCTRANLNACNERDTQGHGTHTSGIIVGGNPGDQYVGVAPGAEIEMIKTTFSTSDIITGIHEAINDGAKVISMSLGSLPVGQPNDGSSLFEQAVDNATSQNVTVIASAGNSAQDNIHSSLLGVSGTFLQHRINVPSSDNFFVVTYLWRDPSKFFGFWYQSPISPAPIQINPSNSIPGCKVDNFGVQYCWATSVSSRGTAEFDVIFSDSTVLPGGTWNFWLDNSNFPISSPQNVEAYTTDGLNPSGAKFLDFVNSSITLGSPSTSDSAISVGSYVSRGGNNCWPGASGQISFFSSIGPRIDGVVKPEVIAPGQTIASAKSSSATYFPCELDDSTHVFMSGTSMAAPHVAGAVALLLQQDPTLKPYQVRNIVSQATETIPTCQGVNQCGNGLIRPDNAYLRLVNLYWHNQSPNIVNLGIFNLSALLKNNNGAAATNINNIVLLPNTKGLQFAPGETGTDFLSFYNPNSDLLFFYRINASALGHYLAKFNLRSDNMGNHYLEFNITVATLNLSTKINSTSKNVIFNTFVYFNDGTNFFLENVSTLSYLVQDLSGNTVLSGTANTTTTGTYTQSINLPNLTGQVYVLKLMALDSKGIVGSSLIPFNNPSPAANNTPITNLTCYSSVKNIPATCMGGIITQDSTTNGRTITCANGSDSMKVQIWEKPDTGTKQYFEMNKQSQNGSKVSDICVGNVCLKGSGYVKSPNYPICFNQGPQANQTTVQNGSLKILTNPNLADVFLNNIFRGATNTSGQLFILNIIPGNYQLTVSKTNYTTNNTNLVLSPGQNLSIFVKLNLNAIGNTTNQNCFTKINSIPAICNGGTVTSDVLSGCRTITCTNISNSLKVQACDKPTSTAPQYYEMYKQAQNGTQLQICLANTCINLGGYAKSPNYPVCV